MNKNLKEANKIKMETVIANMAKRNITGHYADSKEEAVDVVLSLIPEGSTVSWGGSMTLGELGIKEKINEGNYNVNDPMTIKDPAEALEARRQSLLSDVFLASANAVTMDGEILNIDGTGNRIAAMSFGPKRVILIVGANKLALDEDSAYKRIKSDACPANCIRLSKKTPCAATGKCGNCLSKGNTICCYTVTTRYSSTDDRMHVVFVNDNLGY